MVAINLNRIYAVTISLSIGDASLRSVVLKAKGFEGVNLSLQQYIKTYPQMEEWVDSDWFMSNDKHVRTLSCDKEGWVLKIECVKV